MNNNDCGYPQSNNRCLIDELAKLKESSKEAVENLNSFSSFKRYMHITRDAEEQLEDIIKNASVQRNSQLILVCGSVGDGKSHIISYFKNKYPAIMEKFTLYNDATESSEPSKTSMDTLNDVLDGFSDEKIHRSDKKYILAINLGTLNNFIDSEYGERFTVLKRYVYDKKILENSIEDSSFDDDSNIQFINFSDFHMFTLKDGKVMSNYIKSLIKKVTDPGAINIFYNSYKTNCMNCVTRDKCPIKANYEMISEDQVQNSIVDLLVQCIIKSKIIISTRALLNFIYEILIARSYVDVNTPMFKNKISLLTYRDYIRALTPNLLFNHKEVSSIFEALNNLDPLSIRNEKVDDFIIKFNNSTNIFEFFDEYINYPRGYIDRVRDIDFEDSVGRRIKPSILKLFIRSYYICGRGNLLSLKDEVYEKFISNLYWWNKGDKYKLKSLYTEVKSSISRWNGDAEKDQINVFMGRSQLKYKVSEEVRLNPNLSNLKTNKEDELVKFLNTLELKFKAGDSDKSCEIDIDFSLYKLLNKVINGYRPNKKDKSHYIKFIEFISKIEDMGSQSKQLIFTEKNRRENRKYRLEYEEEFETYKFVEI